MSLLSTIPAELLAAAAQLEGIGTSLTAQNAAAATSTAAVAPAASDSVSQLQAGIFSAYGTLYQQIAAEAQAIQQQFVQVLGLSSGSYSTAEATNATAQSATDNVTNFLNSLSTFLGGSQVTSSPLNLSTQPANFISAESGNWASAMSDLLGMAGGGLIPSDWLAAPADAADAAAGAAATAGSTTPMAGGVGMPTAAVGGATLVGSMSAPPSWAASATPVTTVGATALPGTALSSAASSAAPGGLVPAMPGMASAARNSAGFGAPRYGIKPLVMKKLGLVAV